MLVTLWLTRQNFTGGGISRIVATTIEPNRLNFSPRVTLAFDRRNRSTWQFVTRVVFFFFSFFGHFHPILSLFFFSMKKNDIYLHVESIVWHDLYIFFFFLVEGERKIGVRYDERWKEGSWIERKKGDGNVESLDHLFDDARDIIKLNLKKYPSKINPTRFHHRSCISSNSSQWILWNRSDHDSKNVVHEVRRYTRRAEDIERDAPDSPFSAVPARGSLHRPGYPVEEDLFPEHN